MKNILLLTLSLSLCSLRRALYIALLFSPYSLQAQTIPPPYINYQAVLYDVNSANPNAVLANQSFPTFVNIQDELGNLLYKEEHYASTDANGLITVKIGDGVYMAGPITNFNAINWGVGKYYLVVDFDINGTISSTAPEQLVTVPYSFYAGKAGNGMTAVADNGNGTLTFTYENGATYTTPTLSGIQGPVGPVGPQGPQGQPGVTGANGLNALIKTTTEPAGANCTNGGTKIETGLDANGNGVLETSEINAAQTKYVCNIGSNGNSNSVAPIITPNSNGNFSTISGIQVPSFLKYYGNCSSGNKVCVNNEVLAHNSQFCNLTIPLGVTAKVNPAVRTIIYVKDTLFLHGTIDGSGGDFASTSSNLTSNHIGATACGWETFCNSCGSFTAYGGNDSFVLNWDANSLPSTYYESFSGSLAKSAGLPGLQNVSYCNNQNGADLTVTDLLKIMHFGSNISGGNGAAMTVGLSGCQAYANGGQGGAGLYILAKNVVFTGNIYLNGGNGKFISSLCNPTSNVRSSGGGAGSCIISTNNVINNNGNFQSIGGTQVGGACPRKGGNGSMLIIQN